MTVEYKPSTGPMLSSENLDTWNRHEYIESTAKHKPRGQGNIATKIWEVYNCKVEVEGKKMSSV